MIKFFQNKKFTRSCWSAMLLIIAFSYYFTYGISNNRADTDKIELSVYFSDDRLQLDIPADYFSNKAGRLIIDLLDVDDHQLARTIVNLSATNESNQHSEIKLPGKLTREDLVWHRLRYRFIPHDGGKSTEVLKSISEIINFPTVKLIGQRTLMAGSTGSLRLVTFASRTQQVIKQGNIELSIKTPSSETETIKTEIDQYGTTEPKLIIPDGYNGPAELKIKLNTPIGSQQIVEKITIQRRNSILLTTDRPIYQPGHLIYIRSLALDRFSHRAAGQQLITYEIDDAKGNKVFKKLAYTDDYGVASAQFQLAEEVNTGTFKLRAIMGEPGSSQSIIQEKSFTVDKYVLPKFRINIEMPKDFDGQPKKYFTPGEVINGKITVNYIFGKPVTRARIKMELFYNASLPEPNSDNLDQALTDENGSYNFSMKLPSYLVGKDAQTATVALNVEVMDNANHKENRVESVLVSSNPIQITAVPESGDLVRGLLNRVYLVTSYLDGTPAQTEITGLTNQAIYTGKDGIASIEINGAQTQLNLQAKDNQQRMGSASIRLNQRANSNNSVILRTDRALYKVGDSLIISAISTKKNGTIYFDVIKDRQTVLTRAADIIGGKAELKLDLSADLTGAIEVRAYLIDYSADVISDRRMIFIDPADDLKIATNIHKESYRPGEEALIDIDITDRLGRPRAAVLDLQIVDEAVFALSEKRPGLEKLFFHLEQELLKPRYEIHSINSIDLLDTTTEQQIAEQRDRAGQVLFAAANNVDVYNLQNLYGKDLLDRKVQEYQDKYEAKLYKKFDHIIEQMNIYYLDGHASSGEFEKDLHRAVSQGYLNHRDILDFWGRKISFAVSDMKQNEGALYTAIDFPGSNHRALNVGFYYALTTRSKPIIIKQPYTGTITTGKLDNVGYAQIRGRILKSEIEPLRKAQIKIVDASGAVIKTRTDAQGNFLIDKLAPGKYRVLISASGFISKSYQNLVINIGDQLNMVVALPAGKQVMTLHAYGVDGGVEGGVIGGVVGGTVGGFGGGVGTGNGYGRGGRTAPSSSTLPLLTNVKEKSYSESQLDNLTDAGNNSERIRIREYFPETLYVNPVLITDQKGHATLRLPLADSITTWRMSMFASTKQGALGNSTAGVKVFQDFFIDLDLPISLTQDDIVEIPVAVYNYLNSPQNIEVKLQPDEWYRLEGDQPIKSVSVAANEVTSTSFRIRAQRIGNNRLMATASLRGSNSSINGDAIARRIEVVPNGEQQNITINDRLTGSITQEINIPENAINDASKILVKFYPGPLSQVVEGLDSILSMPHGCFEQTSSTTYPNLLALDYMKTTKKITPEIQAKAEKYVSLGYQRLLTFEVPGGGFSWFGNAPANKILTGYGLMEFFDMARVHEVDPRVIKRTQHWIARQQKNDGSWEPDQSFINEGATNNFNNDRVRIAGYLAWTLAYSGYQGPALDLAQKFISSNSSNISDPYTLAVIANFAVQYQPNSAWTKNVIDQLVQSVKEVNKTAYWSTKNITPTYGSGFTAEIETTALITQALLKQQNYSQLATKALNYLISKKDSRGIWHTTQPTVQSLKTLLLSQQLMKDPSIAGEIVVKVNDRPAGSIKITPDNNDLMHQLDLKQFTTTGRNLVEISYNGQGNLLYQMVGRYYLPWQNREQPSEALSINVEYDRTKLSQNDIVVATCTARNNLTKAANMIMIDLGIPPGFELLSEDIEKMVRPMNIQSLGNLTKFSVTGKQLILYYDGLQPQQTINFKYRLKAKYPIKAQTNSSRIYEYYNPSISATAKPIEIIVK